MADDEKSTSKSSASKSTAKRLEEKDPREMSAADREIRGGASVVGGRVKMPDWETRKEEVEGEERRAGPDNDPIPTITIDDQEVALEPDLQGLIVSRAGNARTHPAHESPAYSNYENRSMTEEEAEADDKEWRKRFA